MFTLNPFRHIAIHRLGVTSDSFIVNHITLMGKYHQVYRRTICYVGTVIFPADKFAFVQDGM